ncbi:MAG: hypothetical protein HY960_12380 [Ignavibacteriae bacterium]|nr:hypothetical protein [Ignavibacteriota bacterium]
MRKFKLTQEEVEQTVSNPLYVEDDIKGRKNAWQSYYDRFIKVTYIVEENRTIIITATIKERISKD